MAPSFLRTNTDPLSLSQYPLGAFIEDYAYVAGSGDLDEHNGRFTVTPEYPTGTYAYFVTLDSLLQPAFPYVIGDTYYGTVAAGNTGPGGGHLTVPGGAILYTPSTSVQELGNASLTVFPVPASADLNIRTDGTLLRSIELIDASGRVVSHTAPLGTQVAISLDGLANGFWTARITLADGRVVVRPFVKQP
ncbi:MAG: YHYH protein [Flavobacteriales bacterium]|nr:YHYH protein [Flavobacteriales bacterium]